MATVEKAEKISITLPPDMLKSIKSKVQSGSYGSTSEVIREAMRLWQHQQEERDARLALIRARLERSAKSGKSVPMEQAFDEIRKMHEQRLSDFVNEDV